MTKAAVLYSPNTPMPVVDLTQLPPRRGEVRVQIAAAGVCASDHHVMLGHTSFPLPMVLGHEGAGIVVEVGPDVTSVKVGDRCLLSFVSSCGFCKPCRTGLGQLCATHRETGPLQRDGTARLHDESGRDIYQFAKLGVFAQTIVAPMQVCHPIPDTLSFDVAALIGCSVTTGVGVVIASGFTVGSKTAVFGAGGIGLNTIQALRVAGATQIVAVDISDSKLTYATNFGATDTVNAKTTESVAENVKEITSGGVNYAFDTFGSPVTTRQMMDSLSPGGTGILVGLAPEGVSLDVNAVDLVRNQKTLRGSYYGSVSPFLTFNRVINMLEGGLLDIAGLIQRRYTLDQINEAYDDLADGKDGRGVIVFEN